MGYKKNETTGLFEVYFSKRHPLTRLPVTLRRRGIRTEAEARRVERELVAEVHDRLKEKVVPRWREAVSAYLQSCRDRGLGENTLAGYVALANKYTEQWSERRIDEITTAEIREIVKVQAGTKSHYNQRNLLKVIRGIFTHAVENAWVQRNPVPQVHFPKGEKLKTVLTREHARVLLEKAKTLNWPWYPHYAMALYTGMRNGELYALTWDKVNIDQRQIKVDASWNTNDGFKGTKSGDDRIVEIPPPLIPVLKELKLKTGSSSFVLPRMWQWDKGLQARELRKFLKGVGLPPMSFHSLRASYATLLMGQGVEPIRVMAMAGWKDLKTMQFYIRKAGVDIRGATDRFSLHNPNEVEAKVLSFETGS